MLANNFIAVGFSKSESETRLIDFDVKHFQTQFAEVIFITSLPNIREHDYS